MAYTSIDDPSKHFQALTYRGDSSSTTSSDRNLTNTGNSDLKPDWIWLFNRDTALTGGQKITDSSRGAGSGKSLSSSITNTEGYNDPAYGYVNAFNSDGFGVRAGANDANGRWYVDRGEGGGDKYVAYQWKAGGGTTSTNTDGDINSTVQVNSDAGFSIVTYSPSNATARSIGHGLGVTPSVVITKARNRVEDWRVFHSGAGSTGSLTLNDTSAHNSSTVLHTGVTSTTFGVGTDFSVNGAYNYISYVFAEKQGYSKFGKYTGNGSTDGVFVYTGFKPAFVMIKIASGTTEEWSILDTKRNDSGNPLKFELFANSTSADYNGNRPVDFLSNGFKPRLGGAVHNGSGYTYVYMAFAENPFVTSTGIPTTAR